MHCCSAQASRVDGVLTFITVLYAYLLIVLRLWHSCHGNKITSRFWGHGNSANQCCCRGEKRSWPFFALDLYNVQNLLCCRWNWPFGSVPLEPTFCGFYVPLYVGLWQVCSWHMTTSAKHRLSKFELFQIGVCSYWGFHSNNIVRLQYYFLKGFFVHAIKCMGAGLHGNALASSHYSINLITARHGSNSTRAVTCSAVLCIPLTCVLLTVSSK